MAKSRIPDKQRVVVRKLRKRDLPRTARRSGIGCLGYTQLTTPTEIQIAVITGLWVIGFRIWLTLTTRATGS